MKNYTYYPMAMHLHACNQLGASMESHMYNAHELGMKYIHFTPHDSRTGPKKKAYNSFDFSLGTLVIDDKYGWQEVYGSPEVCFEDGCMVLSASSDKDTYEASGYGYKSSGKSHTVNLMADTSLHVGFTFEAVGDARLVLDVRLSQRAPDHNPAHLRYVVGEVCGCDIPHAVEVPLSVSPDGLYTLDLTADVQRDGIREIVGGLDNAFDNLSILIESRNGGRGTVRFNKFEVKSLYGFEDVIARQRIVADEVGKRFGIKPFVTTEISAAGQHKNYFTSSVPVINYKERNYDVTQAEAIAHVKQYGGVFTYNHPLEKYKRTEHSPEEIAFIVQRDAAAFISSKVWGADCMEVGFVDGRGGFGLNEHLRLWDLISMGGVFITGYGDSDSHNSSTGWFSGNNFAAYIAAPSDMPFPVDEETFNDSLRAGRVYTGDPVFLRGQVGMFCEGKPIGAIIKVSDRDKSARHFTFTAESVGNDWTLRVIADAMPIHELPVSELIDGSGNLKFEFDVNPELPVSFARVEMYNGDGRCVMLTNPIYLVRTAEFAGKLPSQRLYEDTKETAL